MWGELCRVSVEVREEVLRRCVEVLGEVWKSVKGGVGGSIRW